MKELLINRGIFFLRSITQAKKEHHVLGLLLVLWVAISLFFSSPEMTAGINQTMPLLLVIGLLTYLILLETSLWLFNRFLIRMGYPSLQEMVSQFKQLEEWQQLIFLWASYALVLLTGTACIATVL
ncbi:hypothetical protein [Pedobacter africanus]|uniref:Uncharacterized protein n=1 Tax=Pedobacter africanus TaxID=151894 RepID=A0A1W2CVQ0_9SPHI|nr:hypothetical protein [Pedobacter africanus]SMC88902.1 hypothetical protein SAMN04488524_3257 [Pedobacter africanus]